MNQTASVSKLARILSWIAVVILVLLPFHAFITVWLSSAVGHYTLIRLWKEFLLVIIMAGAIFIVVNHQQLRKKLFSFWSARLIGIYFLVLSAWGLTALAKHDVTGKAMWYGLLVNLRFLIFFLAVWVITAKSDFLTRQWKKVLLAPAIIVSAFAVLQYLVLPYDFLRHFGYGESTISPYETINHNLNHIRVASTSRGANPLGAYLIVPLSALAALLFRNKSRRRDGFLVGFGILLALAFSFSRSAWIGSVLSLIIIGWVLVKNPKTKKVLLIAVAGVAILGALLALTLRNNTNFENVVFHTDHTSKIEESSNEGHSAAFKNAARDIIHEPLGRGVGTAGPESVYNNHPGRIAENYFLQIGQEAGIIGMVLFVAICAAVAKQLWTRRSNTLALGLLASLVGITFINLLSHAWTDDTLAYLWWGLAAIACAPVILADRHKQKNGKKIKTAA